MSLDDALSYMWQKLDKGNRVDWGEGGFFRIRRGTNECGIESLAYAGWPVVVA